MSVTIESLEGRTLFTAGDVAAVSADYATVVQDATALKFVVAAAYTAYKADVKTVTADIKALPKNKTNTADEAALKKTVTAAGVLDTRDGAKVIAIGKSNLTKARAAFLAVVHKPPPAAETKLEADLASLGTILSVSEAQLATDAGTGETRIAASLTVLVAANPTATPLSTDVTSAETQGSSSLDSIAAEVSTINTDLATLIADVG